MSKIGNYIIGRGEEVASHKYMKSLEGNYEPSVEVKPAPAWEDMTSEEYDKYRQNWMDKYTND